MYCLSKKVKTIKAVCFGHLLSLISMRPPCLRIKNCFSFWESVLGFILFLFQPQELRTVAGRGFNNKCVFMVVSICRDDGHDIKIIRSGPCWWSSSQKRNWRNHLPLHTKWTSFPAFPFPVFLCMIFWDELCKRAVTDKTITKSSFLAFVLLV